MIPESSLSQLSAEDLRLLLCGCPHIDVDVVRGITIFDDESRKCTYTYLLQSLVTALSLRQGPGAAVSVQGLVLVSGGANDTA